jgi:hypothetical protein
MTAITQPCDSRQAIVDQSESIQYVELSLAQDQLADFPGYYYRRGTGRKRVKKEKEKKRGEKKDRETERERVGKNPLPALFLFLFGAPRSLSLSVFVPSTGIEC